jgi:hypothetical protein
MLTLAALFAASGGHITLPKGPVYIEDAGVYVNSSGGTYLVKAWRDGFQLVVLSKPIPIHSIVKVEGGHVNITLLTGDCRTDWLNQSTPGSIGVSVNATTTRTHIQVELNDAWRALGLSCRGGVEVILLVGPGGNVVSTELTPVYTLSSNQNARSLEGAKELHDAAKVAVFASLTIAVVAWVVERRSRGGG